MRAWANTGLRWTWATLLAMGCVLVSAYAFAFLTYRPYEPHDPFMVRFALEGLAVPAHFFGAGLALLLVPVQASRWIRRRLPTLHRIGGGLSVGGIVVAGIGGLAMATQSHRGWATGIAFALLAIAWLTTMGLGVRAVVRRDFVAHRRWMLRCMALTAAAITLRIILAGGLVLRLPFDAVYITAAWSSWLLNLALCEAWLRWPAWRMQRRQVVAASAFALHR